MQETQEMQVWFLGQEDPLEEDMATHSSILAWKFPWTEEPGGLQSMGLQSPDTTEQLSRAQDIIRSCLYRYVHTLCRPAHMPFRNMKANTKKNSPKLLK